MSLFILINIKVLVYMILEDLIWKLKLKIKANNEIKVVLLGKENKIKIINLIFNISIIV